MIEIINLRNCRESYVKYGLNYDLFNLIIDDNEVLFFKFGDFILVNKFSDNKVIDNFDDERRDYYNKNYSSYDDDFRKMNGLFELDRTYLNFVSSGCFSSFGVQSFSKFKNNLVRNFDYLDCFDYEEKVFECSRDELEKKFNYNNYDSMYVFNDYGNFLFVGNKVDGVLLSDKLIPDDEELVKLDLRSRKFNIACNGGDINSVKKLNRRDISEIDNLFIYGYDKRKYYIVTSLDGVLNVSLFNLKYVGKDKFVLRVKNVYNNVFKEENNKCKVRSK